MLAMLLRLIVFYHSIFLSYFLVTYRNFVHPETGIIFPMRRMCNGVPMDGELKNCIQINSIIPFPYVEKLSRLDEFKLRESALLLYTPISDDVYQEIVGLLILEKEGLKQNHDSYRIKKQHIYESLTFYLNNTKIICLDDIALNDIYIRACKTNDHHLPFSTNAYDLDWLSNNTYIKQISLRKCIKDLIESQFPKLNHIKKSRATEIPAAMELNDFPPHLIGEIAHREACLFLFEIGDPTSIDEFYKHFTIRPFGWNKEYCNALLIEMGIKGIIFFSCTLFDLSLMTTTALLTYPNAALQIQISLYSLIIWENPFTKIQRKEIVSNIISCCPEHYELVKAMMLKSKIESKGLKICKYFINAPFNWSVDYVLSLITYLLITSDLNLITITGNSIADVFESKEPLLDAIFDSNSTSPGSDLTRFELQSVRKKMIEADPEDCNVLRDYISSSKQPLSGSKIINYFSNATFAWSPAYIESLLVCIAVEQM